MIRSAAPADSEAIAAIWSTMIRDTLATFTTVEKSAREIREMIAARPGAFLVAETDGVVDGFLTFGPFRTGPGYAGTAEHTVILRKGAQREGTGRALMEAGAQAAQAAGVHVMVAAISSANPVAIAFHAKLGFTEVGRMPEVGRKSGRWLDLVLMQKIL